MKSPYRVSLSGTFSTGKSTLVKKLALLLDSKQVMKYYIINEVARKVLQQGYKLDKEANIESYLFYIFLQLQEERIGSQFDILISDRTLIDLLAYVRVNNDQTIPLMFTKLLQEIIWRGKQYFTHYCYIPIEFLPVDDGVRCIDIDYQKLVDLELTKIFNELSINPIIIKGDLDKRIDTVYEVIKKDQVLN
ncbi:MAG: AAA family ATPase [Bacteroidetes bacterium]|nr:AAA family ATPase [Bacteroidota bacterium]